MFCTSPTFFSLKDIHERHVLLLDPILCTGNSAKTAIKELLSKGVPQERILFLTLIAAPTGITKICSSFPEVKVREREREREKRERDRQTDRERV